MCVVDGDNGIGGDGENPGEHRIRGASRFVQSLALGER